MLHQILNLSIKDWLIVISLLILLLSFLRIRKQKRLITQEVQKRLFPQLGLELILDPDINKMGLFLRNDGFFIIRDIRIEDVELTLEDYGYKQNFIIRFEDMDFLRPKEKIKLEFKILDKEEKFLPRVTDTIIPHLINPSFNVRIYYSNVENFKFYVTFFKQNEKFYIESIKPLGSLKQ